MTDPRYTVRIATRREVDLAVAWAAQEGWNPGLHDAHCFHAADAEGFLVGLLDGEPVATLSAVRYGEGFGFLGFYIVRPDQRGNGYGWAIWQQAMERMTGRVVGLDGVVAQQENYRKSGFDLAYRNVRYQGHGGRAPADEEVVTLDSLPFDRIATLDRILFPAEREAFLRAWIDQPDSHALGIVEEGRLVAQGVIRRCLNGWKIGPLVAENPFLAERLFQALRGRVGTDETVYLDVPEVNPEAVALARDAGMEVVFETARMYRGEAPSLPLERIFGVTSFELG